MKILDIYTKHLSTKDKENSLKRSEDILIEYILKDKASRG